MKAFNFDFIAKLSSTDYNESNKPNLKSLADIGSKKSLVEIGVTKNKLSLFSHHRCHKKPPMCQIMHFSLYYINGAIECRRID